MEHVCEHIYSGPLPSTFLYEIDSFGIFLLGLSIYALQLVYFFSFPNILIGNNEEGLQVRSLIHDTVRIATTSNE